MTPAQTTYRALIHIESEDLIYSYQTIELWMRSLPSGSIVGLQSMTRLVATLIDLTP